MELTDVQEKSETDRITATNYHLYKKRWLILIFFYAYNFSNVMQWIQYSSIADVVVNYYQISHLAINWSSLAGLLIGFFLAIPGSYVIDKLGIRISVLIGITGTAVGSWIKVASVHPSRYWVYLVGQGIVASFQVVVFPLAPKLAAVWFGAKEVSLACSLNAIASQIGVAIGFVIPPLIVKEGKPEMVEMGLNKMLYSYSTYATILIPILYFWFDDAPPTPPSKAQTHKLQKPKILLGYMPSLARVLKCKSFLALSVTYGVNVGGFIVLSVLLNEIILSYYCDAFEDVGIIGLLMTCTGIFGMFVTGIIITKFKRLKQITIALLVFSLIFTTAFLFLMDFGLPLVYFNSICLSIFTVSFVYIGYELGMEFTYPEPEEISGSLLAQIPNPIGIGMLYAYSYMFYNVSKLSANLLLVSLLLISDLLLVFVKFRLKRQDMEEREEILNVEI